MYALYQVKTCREHSYTIVNCFGRINQPERQTGDEDASQQLRDTTTSSFAKTALSKSGRSINIDLLSWIESLTGL